MNLRSVLIQKEPRRYPALKFVSSAITFFVITVLFTVNALAFTVEKDGINTVYTADWSDLSYTITSNAVDVDDIVSTVTAFGNVYRYNGGINYPDRVIYKNINASLTGDNLINVYYGFDDNVNISSSRMGRLIYNFRFNSESFNFSTTKDVVFSFTCTDITYASISEMQNGFTLTLYNGSEVVFDQAKPNVTLLNTYTDDVGLTFYSYRLDYAFSLDPSDTLSFTQFQINGYTLYSDTTGLDNNNYNRLRFSFSDVLFTELANQSVQDYYTAVQAGNSDMKLYFNTVSSSDQTKLDHNSTVNNQLSSTVGEYTSTSTELPDFNLGSEFYSPSLDVESDSGATSDLWDLFFGAWSEGDSSSFNFFFKRVLSVITVVAVISLVITGIPNILRFRGD